MTTDGFSLFPHMPKLNLSPYDKTASLVGFVALVLPAVVWLLGPIPVAVPLMAWFVAHAYRYERHFRYV